MADHGVHMISRLQKAWERQLLLACLALTIALSLFSMALAMKFLHAGWIWLPLLFIVSAIISYFLVFRKIHAKEVASYIDKTIPLVEESSSLLLKPDGELNFFEKLQVGKIEKQLQDQISPPPGIIRKQKRTAIALMMAIAFAAVLYVLPTPMSASIPEDADAKRILPKEIKLAGIAGTTVTISPPAYTGRSPRSQELFNIEAEEESQVQWKINTSLPARELRLIFNDSSVIQLIPSADSLTWVAAMQVRKAGFYQIKLGDSLSEFYKIEMIADQLPEISVHSPAPNAVIEPGMPLRTIVDVSVTDDYGLSASSLFATIASGTGESVAFREQRIPFNDFVPGRRSINLRKQLDLLQLKMAPGDELYFYISATDNRSKEKRSDIFIIRIEDTTELMSLEGLASGIDIKPEFFRSQRQIIIETEQLLKDQATMSKEAFTNKSNDLGIDQRLLRLRYGKFLGEETDAEIGGDAHDEEGHDDADVGDMMDRYTHKHDNAEDATFFDPETKKQLKATLAEMWKAELQLRTIKPRDALPFEYRALRLLKDLQQKTRAYVSKTGIKTTPLDPKKRLTAELTGIQQVITTKKISSPEEKQLVSRKALGILETLRGGEKLSAEGALTLQTAVMGLSDKAAKEPSVYLVALTSLNKILTNKYTVSDLEKAGTGLMKMIGPTRLAPVKSKKGEDGNLSEKYFNKMATIND